MVIRFSFMDMEASFMSWQKLLYHVNTLLVVTTCLFSHWTETERCCAKSGKSWLMTGGHLIL